MPRRWTNSSHSRGGGSHIFVEPTPVRTADLKVVDEILAHNSRMAEREARALGYRLRYRD